MPLLATATGLLFQSTSPERGTTVNRIGRVIISNISIHVPRAGDDVHKSGHVGVYVGFQSTSPERGTTTLHLSAAVTTTFQSTSPERGTTRPDRFSVNFNPISIHVPRAGDDERHLRYHYNSGISIHVPRAGDDDFQCFALR